MQSPELILCHKTERVTIFKIPPLSTSKGYYLDDWKDMIWQGGVKVTQKNRIIKITFIDKKGNIFGQTKVPNNYKQAIVKTNDSSRGYAVRLQNPKGGFLWIGVAFRDRNDAFDFGVVFQDEANRNKLQENPNMLKQEFGGGIDFSLKKGQKVKINIGGKQKKQQKMQSSKNQFDFDFGFSSQKKPQTNISSKEWSDFDFGFPQSNKVEKKQQKKSNNNVNLLDL